MEKDAEPRSRVFAKMKNSEKNGALFLVSDYQIIDKGSFGAIENWIAAVFCRPTVSSIPRQPSTYISPVLQGQKSRVSQLLKLLLIRFVVVIIHILFAEDGGVGRSVLPLPNFSMPWYIYYCACSRPPFVVFQFISKVLLSIKNFFVFTFDNCL